MDQHIKSISSNGYFRFGSNEYLVIDNEVIFLTLSYHDEKQLLYTAVKNGHLDIVKNFPDYVDSDVFGMALWHGHINIIKYIFTHIPRAKISNLRIYGENPLSIASERGHLEVVKYIIENEAKDRSRDGHPDFKDAAMNGHLEVVKYLVRQLNINIRIDKDYALRWAAGNGHLEVVKYLVDIIQMSAGIDNTPIRWAAKRGRFNIVKYLFSVNAYTDIDEAIRWALEGCNSGIAYYLYKHGGNIPIYNADKQTREIARYYRRVDKINLFRYLTINT